MLFFLKKIKKRFLLLLLAVVLTTPQYACRDFVKDYEISPNNPETASPELLLSATCVNVFFIYTSELARPVAIFMQSQAGVRRQQLGLDRYESSNFNAGGVWGAYYTGMVPDIKFIEQLSVKENKEYILGIAKVLQAMALGVVTDAWGDVPFSEAGRGTDLETPKYDAQVDVYAQLQTLLDEALAIFAKPEVAAFNGSLAADLVFNGDITKWRVTAQILKARYHNHLSKIDPSGSAQKALAAIDAASAAGLVGPENDARAVFLLSQAQNNFWYAFNANWGDITMGKYIVDTMKAANDPRLPLYAGKDAADGYSGYPAGGDGITSPDNVSYLGALYGSPDSYSPMVTFVEAKFIEAEAAFRLGDKTRAATAYNAALAAALSLPGVSAVDKAAYISAQEKTAANITLNDIMHQKYLALFLQIESWTDWRRTGVPNLKPANGSTTGGQIPRHAPTPQNEVLYNPKAIVIDDITTRVWWDKP